MNKKRSLGSSPIGLASEKKSKMSFIPDLGVSGTQTETKELTLQTNDTAKESSHSKIASHSSQTQKKARKKVVSYNLEVELINQIKRQADKQGMYYSGLVSRALKSWFAKP